MTISDDLLNRLQKKFNTSESKECEVTNKEYDLIERHHQFEKSVLQDILSNPIALQEQLPILVRSASLKWEKAVEVFPEGDCCDLYSRSAGFNGAWRIGQTYALSYDVDENGEVASSFQYLIVIDSAGRLVWSVYPADYKGAGMGAQQKSLIKGG